MSQSVAKEAIPPPPADESTTGDSALPGRARGGRSSSRRLAVLWATRIAVLVLLLGLWQLAVSSGLVDPFWISSPALVAERLGEYVGQASFWTDFSFTAREGIFGVVLGGVTGIVSGCAFGYAQGAFQAVQPIIAGLYTLPPGALAPLFVIWFGIGITSKVALVVSIVYFITLINTYEGVRQVDQDLRDSVRTMGASRLFLTWHVMIPACTPWIITGLRFGFIYGIGGAIVGEMLIAEHGLGLILTQSSNAFDTTGVFAVLLVIGLFGALADLALSLVDKKMLAWNRPVE